MRLSILNISYSKRRVANLLGTLGYGLLNCFFYFNNSVKIKIDINSRFAQPTMDWWNISRFV